MSASRIPMNATTPAATDGLPTAALVRRRRRPPPWTRLHIAIRQANHLRRIATAPRFKLIVDDYDKINPVTRTAR